MGVTLREAHEMMHPFLTLDDGTEIVHSEMLRDVICSAAHFIIP